MRKGLKNLCLALLACLTAGLAGCTFPVPAPPEYLDPNTAALVTTVAAPIVFARSHLDVAANARQYATVAAVSINRSGRYEYVLLVYLWSTIDPRLGSNRHPGQNVILLADDRAIRLVRDSRSLHEVGISTPLHARNTYAANRAFTALTGKRCNSSREPDECGYCWRTTRTQGPSTSGQTDVATSRSSPPTNG